MANRACHRSPFPHEARLAHIFFYKDVHLQIRKFIQHKKKKKVLNKACNKTESEY